MAMLTRCPHCETVCKTDPGNANRPVSCRKCGRIFVALGGNAVAKSETQAPVRPGATQRQQPTKRTRPQPDVYTVPGLELQIVQLNPGTFRQGFEAGFPDEAPIRTVTLSAGFGFSRFPVTQAQYVELMYANPSYYSGSDRPVETVTWHEAVEFCCRLTERERVAGRLESGAHFRLPTEAEWEFACRTTPADVTAGQDPGRPCEGGAYCFGDDPGQLPEYAWFADNSDGTTHPVGEKELSPWGLADLHGNVSEWCRDWYAVYAAGDVTDPGGPPQGGRKVRRGGCHASTAKRCRATDRVGVSPDCACALLGFRVALVRGGENGVEEAALRIW